MFRTKPTKTLLSKMIRPLLFTNKYNLTEINSQLNFTPKFYDVVQEKLTKKDKNYFLRLEIFAGQGCQGFTYNFKFDNQLDQANDYVKSIVEIKNNPETGKDDTFQKILFAVNCQEIKLLRGATIDFAEQMMREVFYVSENPNAEIQCSCKTSFSPKEGIL